MRKLAVVLPLLFAGCSANSHYSDPRLVSTINKTYEARDTCLAKNAVPYAGGDTDAANIARAVSLSCQSETDKLISVSNPTRDPAITAAIPSGHGIPGYRLCVEGPRPDPAVLDMLKTSAVTSVREERVKDESARAVAAKIALADLMIRKAGLIRTIRHEMHKQGIVYFNGLTEILEAIEHAKREG